jgi:hypothetical protein
VNTRRILVFGVESALLTSRDKECGFLKKTENSIAKIRLRGSSGSIVVFNVVLPGAKSGGLLLHGPETECIQAITPRKFGSDLLIRFPAENEISDDRSMLQQERHC